MTATTHPTRAPLAANLICMASMLFWAAGMPAAYMLVDKVPPLPLAAIRMSLAALVLLPFWLAVDGRAAVRRANWTRGILIGGSTVGLAAYLLVISQRLTDAATVAVITATIPLVGIALEVLLDGRKMTPGLIIGLLLSLAGGALSLVGGTAELSLDLGFGALACFGSVLVYTIGSRLTVTAFPTLTPLGGTAITLSGAAILTSLAAIAGSAFGSAGLDWHLLGWPELGALVVFSVGGLAVTQLLWIVSINRLGIGLASLHMNATPFYVMIFLFALGGSWNWSQTLAAAIVVLGVLIAQGIIGGKQE